MAEQGFADSRSGNYFTIYDGKFAIRVPAETEGAVKRINKLGKEVWEIFHTSLTARLVNIRITDGTYGKSWEFDFSVNGEIRTLQLSYSNSYATNLLKILPNADLTKDLKLQPSQKIEDNKKKSSLFVSQDGVTLKHAYTLENPNGLPPMAQVTIKGVLTWDDSDRLAFLEEMVKRDLLPKLPKNTEAEQEPLATDSDELSDNDF